MKNSTTECIELNQLADSHFYGINGKTKDIQKAKNIYKKSAKLGCEEGSYKYSYIITYINKIQDTDKRYNRLVEILAEYGDTIAIEELKKLSLIDEVHTTNQQREYIKIKKESPKVLKNTLLKKFKQLRNNIKTYLQEKDIFLHTEIEEKTITNEVINTTVICNSEPSFLKSHNLSLKQIKSKYAYTGAIIEEIYNKVNCVPTLRYMVEVEGKYKSCNNEHEIQHTINKLLTYTVKKSTVLNNFYKDLKTKYLTGKYILINRQNGKNIIEYSFKDNLAEHYKLIHKKHKDVLEHWLNGGEVLGGSWNRYFLSDYDEDENYTIFVDASCTDDSKLKDYMENQDVSQYFNIVSNIESMTKEKVVTKYGDIINYLACIGILTYCEVKKLTKDYSMTSRRCY